MNLEKLFVCPATGNEVEISYEDRTVYVRNSARTYPIKDGIIDFIPDVADKISGSYDTMSSEYDSLPGGSGAFAPPFYDEARFLGLLDRNYEVTDRHCLKSLFSFNCTKR